MSLLMASVLALLAFTSTGASGVEPQLLSAGGLSHPDRLGPRDVESHGWIIVPTPRATAVIHVPPRSPIQVGGGKTIETPPRGVHHVAELRESPEAVAAWDRRAYLLFAQPQSQAEPQPRRLLTVSVFPAPLGTGWGADSGERLTALPPLEAQGRLIGFVGTRFGPSALLYDRASAGPDGPLRLLVLVDHQAWREVPIPSEVLDAARPGLSARSDLGWVQLLPHANGVSLFVRSDVRCGLWAADVTFVPDESSRVDAQWRWAPLAREAGSPDARIGPLHICGGHVTYARRLGDGAISIRQMTSDKEIEIRRLSAPTGIFGIVPLDASARLAVFTQTSDERRAARSSHAAYDVTEISAHTGRVLAQGPVGGASPVSRRFYQGVAVALFVLATVALIVLIRPRGDPGVVALPTGVAIAPPMARIIAGMLDFATAFLLVRGLLENFTPGLVLFTLELGMAAYILLVLTMGFIHATIGEAIFGRSIGKALTGCRVISVRDASDQAAKGPSLGAAILRNLVRWFFPPLAWTFMSRPGEQHRGDRLARTTVITPIDSPDDRASD